MVQPNDVQSIQVYSGFGAFIIVVVCGFVILIGYFVNIVCFLAYVCYILCFGSIEIITQMARRGPFRERERKREDRETAC